MPTQLQDRPTSRGSDNLVLRLLAEVHPQTITSNNQYRFYNFPERRRDLAARFPRGVEVMKVMITVAEEGTFRPKKHMYFLYISVNSADPLVLVFRDDSPPGISTNREIKSKPLMFIEGEEAEAFQVAVFPSLSFAEARGPLPVLEEGQSVHKGGTSSIAPANPDSTASLGAFFIVKKFLEQESPPLVRPRRPTVQVAQVRGQTEYTFLIKTGPYSTDYLDVLCRVFEGGMIDIRTKDGRGSWKNYRLEPNDAHYNVIKDSLSKWKP